MMAFASMSMGKRTTAISFLLASVVSVSAFAPSSSSPCSLQSLVQSQTQQSTNSNSCSSSCVVLRQSSSSNNNTPKPQNEFSRTFRADNILGPQRNKRAYNAQIEANSNELQQLATRFSLSKITKLDATFTLQHYSLDAAATDTDTSSTTVDCIRVEGEVMASVTQTCVRTNEDFDVDLEIPLMVIVRPCASSFLSPLEENEEEQQQQEFEDLGGMSAADIEAALGGTKKVSRTSRKKKKQQQQDLKPKKTRGGNSNSNKQSLSNMNMKDIESLLQGFNDDDGAGFEDEVMEDENIFGNDGILDVGELVSQIFRLKLDPYPKKPGSEPVSYSITG